MSAVKKACSEALITLPNTDQFDFLTSFTHEVLREEKFDMNGRLQKLLSSVYIAATIGQLKACLDRMYSALQLLPFRSR